MPGLFDDLLVIDCASFIAAPAAATVLSDFGARVIKVEPPGGEGYRMFSRLPGMPPSEHNYPWDAINRNKESLCLNLKEQQGQDILRRLIARADIFITNYPLPVRHRLQLDYASLSALNPRLIYASFTPYGESGPDAELTGYDATAWWARSGLMDAVRANQETEPAISVPGMGDYPSGLALYSGIVSALYRRQKEGVGGEVSSSLLGNGLWSNSVRAQARLNGADMSVSLSRGQRSIFTEIYQTADNTWLLLTILPQVQAKIWPKLAACLGHPEWVDDPRFKEPADRRRHNAELLSLIDSRIRTRSRSEWTAEFDRLGITYGLVSTPDDFLNDQQPRAAGMIVEYADIPEKATIDSPVYVDNIDKRRPAHGAELGCNTVSILSELGYSDDESEQLITNGIAFGAT